MCDNYLSHFFHFNGEQMPKLATKKKHVEECGSLCPACGSSNLSGNSVQVESGVAWQGVECDDCKASWNDVFKLIGYEELSMVEK